MKDLDIIKLAADSCSGKIDIAQAHAAIQVNSGKAGLFKSGNILSVLDIDGNPIITGKRYSVPNVGTVLVTEESFGAGNIMCTYYRVHYIYGKDLEKGFKVIDGKGSPFSGFTYKSEFKLIEE